MSGRLSDPQRLVELVADQMYREEMRSRNGRGPVENAAIPDEEAAQAAQAAKRHSPCNDS